MPDSRHFELNGDVGLAPRYLQGPDGEPVENPAAGTPDPLVRFGVTVAVPTLVDGELVAVATAIDIERAPALSDTVRSRVIPDTRIVETSDALVANVIAQHPAFHEIESPTKKVEAAAAKATEDARAAAAAVPTEEVK